MRKLLVGIVFSFLFTLSASAQEYKNAAGARLGIPLSGSYKMYISEHHAIEAIGGIYSDVGVNYVTAGAAYLIHNKLENEAFEHLYWYYGLGGAAFLGDGTNFIAVQGYLGISLSLDDIPLNLSIDWVPTQPFSRDREFVGGYGSLAARYILNR